MLVSPTPQRMFNEPVTLALGPLGAYRTASHSPTPVAPISKVFLPSVCKTGALTCSLSAFLPLFSFMEYLTLCISVYGPSLRSTEAHAASDGFEFSTAFQSLESCLTPGMCHTNVQCLALSGRPISVGIGYW